MEPASAQTLQTGQCWKFEKEHLEILLVGKMLAHYRVTPDGRKRGTIKMNRIEVIQEYLAKKGGKLV